MLTAESDILLRQEEFMARFFALALDFRGPGHANLPIGQKLFFALEPCKAEVSTIEDECRPAAGLSASANQPAPGNQYVQRTSSAMQSSGSRPHFVRTGQVLRLHK